MTCSAVPPGVGTSGELERTAQALRLDNGPKLIADRFMAWYGSLGLSCAIFN